MGGSPFGPNGHGMAAGLTVPEDGWEDRAPVIGVFDSGLGGLTVAREIMGVMPGGSLLYLADTAHVPYGPRPAHEIRAFARGIIRALLEEGASAIVAACNMSSALALPIIEDCPVPLIGMIGPGAAAALHLPNRGTPSNREARPPGGPIGVLATEGTCDSAAYPARIASMLPGTAVIQSACPDFVPLVESGRTSGTEAQAAAERYLRPLLDAGCRTIILGCTHYPWLLPVLEAIAGPGVRFVDPACAAAVELRDRIGRVDFRRRGRPIHRFAATALPERLEAGVRRWLRIETTAEHWPLWEDLCEDPSASHPARTSPPKPA